MMKNYFDNQHNALDKYEKLYSGKIRLVAAKMILRNIKWMICGTKNKKIVSDDNRLHILFELQGGLGDILIALNYIQNFKDKLAKNAVINISVVDHFYEEVSVFLHGHDFINCIFKNSINGAVHDLEIRLVRIPVILSVNKKKIAQLSSALSAWGDQEEEFCQTYPEYIHHGTVSDGLLNWRTLAQGQNRISQADVIKAIGIKDAFRIQLANATEILNKFQLEDNQFIVLQNGAGLGSRPQNMKMTTRDWTTDNFNQLTKLLKQEYPKYKIVQVGYDDNDVIQGTDSNLLGQTNFSELLVIANSAKLVIGTESGIIHFRHFASSKPSVVLFGPTDTKILGYSENLNIVASHCIGCDWMHRNWREYCFKTGTNESFCMKAIKPEMVIDKIKLIFNKG